MRRKFTIASGFLLIAVFLFGLLNTAYAQVNETREGRGATGLQGRISAPPPKIGARITIPSNGQVFTSLPITVAGTCPTGLLVKIFKNNVFAGSTQCKNGSFSLIIDLFSGQNILVARVYDDLDQAGPDSNRVTVTYQDNRPGAVSRPTLTTNFAKLGADPGDKLVWPIVLTGGRGPYAVSVDWGDGTDPDLFSLENAGPFDITHVYDKPGVYNIIVKATDKNGATAFLQLVGVANGPLSQQNQDQEEVGEENTIYIVLWQPAALLLPLIILAFWLGRRNQMKELRKKIMHGERPF